MRYADLLVWQKAMDLVTEVYQATKGLPAEEKFGLTSQMRRAAVSIPSNIAEGHGRKMTGAFLNHLSIAYGSLMELETQLQVGLRLGYLEERTTADLLIRCGEVSRMLSGLRSSLGGDARSSILDPRSS